MCTLASHLRVETVHTRVSAVGCVGDPRQTARPPLAAVRADRVTSTPYAEDECRWGGLVNEFGLSHCAGQHLQPGSGQASRKLVGRVPVAGQRIHFAMHIGTVHPLETSPATTAGPTPPPFRKDPVTGSRMRSAGDAIDCDTQGRGLRDSRPC